MGRRVQGTRRLAGWTNSRIAAAIGRADESVHALGAAASRCGVVGRRIRAFVGAGIAPAADATCGVASCICISRVTAADDLSRLSGLRYVRVARGLLGAVAAGVGNAGSFWRDSNRGPRLAPRTSPCSHDLAQFGSAKGPWFDVGIRFGLAAAWGDEEASPRVLTSPKAPGRVVQGARGELEVALAVDLSG